VPRNLALTRFAAALLLPRRQRPGDPSPRCSA